MYVAVIGSCGSWASNCFIPGLIIKSVNMNLHEQAGACRTHDGGVIRKEIPLFFGETFSWWYGGISHGLGSGKVDSMGNRFLWV